MNTVTKPTTTENQATSDDTALTAPRKLSIPLIVGILVVPFIGAWFTLRKGYSTRARTISFVWLAFVCLASGNGGSKVPATPTAEVQVAEAEPVQQRVLTPREANLQLIEQVRAKGGICTGVANQLEMALDHAERTGNDSLFMETLGRGGEYGC